LTSPVLVTGPGADLEGGVEGVGGGGGVETLKQAGLV